MNLTIKVRLWRNLKAKKVTKSLPRPTVIQYRNKCYNIWPIIPSIMTLLYVLYTLTFFCFWKTHKYTFPYTPIFLVCSCVTWTGRSSQDNWVSLRVSWTPAGRNDKWPIRKPRTLRPRTLPLGRPSCVYPRSASPWCGASGRRTCATHRLCVRWGPPGEDRTGVHGHPTDG